MKIEILFFIFLGVVVMVFGKKPCRRSRFRRKQSRSNRTGFSAKLPPFDSESVQAYTDKSVLRGRVWVIDGDTLIIQKTQVRLFGIDAPEINHPYGQKAKWALVSLCKSQIVHAEITAQDDHGRTVAKCSLLDGRDLSAEMVKLGLAIDWQKFSGGIYRLLELPDVRKKLWLADARQKGRMYVWDQFEAKQKLRVRKTKH